MTSLVDAIKGKYEKLSESHIFGESIAGTFNRFGSNLLFSSRTLTMDCQNISCIGSEDELKKDIKSVIELDLAGNKLDSWKEIFTLLRCFTRLESINLSQNPLGIRPLEPQDQRFNKCDNFDENVDKTEIVVDAENENCNSNQKRYSSSGSNSPTSSQDPDNSFSDKMEFDESISRLSSSTNPPNTNIQVDYKSAQNLPSPLKIGLENQYITSDCYFPNLTVLAINSTFIPWNWLIELLQLFPKLMDLHVALNNYGSDESIMSNSNLMFYCNKNNGNNNNNKTSSNNGTIIDNCRNSHRVYSNLLNLYLSDNGLQDWFTIYTLGLVFPSLTHLVLLGNPIQTIPKPSAFHTTTTTCTSHQTNFNNNIFPKLNTLGLSETLINDWTSIDALAEWMPNLTNLRLGNTLPVFGSSPERECRAHVIARLFKLATYNRSEIDSDERENAEREFVRYYGQFGSDMRPDRYWELEHRHGRLQPLADIDLSPKRVIRVRVALNGKELWHNFNMNSNVSQIKRQICQLFGINNPTEFKQYRLYYYDQIISKTQGPEELKFSSRALHSYKPESGDLFELVQCSF